MWYYFGKVSLVSSMGVGGRWVWRQSSHSAPCIPSGVFCVASWLFYFSFFLCLISPVLLLRIAFYFLVVSAYLFLLLCRLVFSLFLRFNLFFIISYVLFSHTYFVCCCFSFSVCWMYQYICLFTFFFAPLRCSTCCGVCRAICGGQETPAWGLWLHIGVVHPPLCTPASRHTFHPLIPPTSTHLSPPHNHRHPPHNHHHHHHSPHTHTSHHTTTDIHLPSHNHHHTSHHAPPHNHHHHSPLTTPTPPTSTHLPPPHTDVMGGAPLSGQWAALEWCADRCTMTQHRDFLLFRSSVP